MLGRLLPAILLAGALPLLAPSAPAAAAGTWSVDDTTDTPVGQSRGDERSGLSLREAVTAANASPGADTILVGGGTYVLDNGHLSVTDDLTITRVGAGEVTIVGPRGALVLTGGDVTLRLLTFTGGDDAAAITGAPDSLTVESSTFRGNMLGTIDLTGGSLTVRRATPTLPRPVFTENRAWGPGGAIDHSGPGAVTIEEAVFTGNVSNSLGGALHVSGSEHALVDRSTFTDNLAAEGGGAIAHTGGNLNVTRSTLTGNTTFNSGAGVIASISAETDLSHNRIVDNPDRVDVSGTGGTLTAARNWWGCNSGPSFDPCDSVDGDGVFYPWLVLTASAPTHVDGPNGTATVTASLAVDSDGAAVAAEDLLGFRGTPVTFSDPRPSPATVDANATIGADGTATSTYDSRSAPSGQGRVTATLDHASESALFTIRRRTVFTSAASTTAVVGAPFTFDVVSESEQAAAAVSSSGMLPDGVTLSDDGDGTATLAGTPAPGTSGSYPLTLTADNGLETAAQQAFTLVISGTAPSVTTQPEAASVAVGATATFTAAASGDPTPTVRWQVSGDDGASWDPLPDAVDTTLTFTVARADDGHLYRAVFTSSSGSATTDSARLAVGDPPVVTSATAARFRIGDPGAFTVTVTGSGTPVVSHTGDLPGGVTFTDNGDGTATLAGTPGAGTSGSFPLAITARTPFGVDTQSFTLTVGGITPTVTTDPEDQTVDVGETATFVASAAGDPAPDVRWEVSTDGATWDPVPGEDDTTLSLTAARADDGHRFRAVFTNADGSATTAVAVLTVRTDPAFTSADAAAFTIGTPGTFAVTVATRGAPTTIESAGVLPEGVSLTDHGDGTATLAGTPAAGTSGGYALSLTADNGLGTPAVQPFTLTVRGLPPLVTTDPGDLRLTPGDTARFTAAATGDPAPAVQWEVSSDEGATWDPVPAADDAVLELVAALGDDGDRYRAVFTSAAGTDISAPAVLRVRAAPVFTSSAAATFTVGAAGAFTVAVDGSGEPVRLSRSGALPRGVGFVDNGDGTATLAGTPEPGTAGTYQLTMTADHGYGTPVDQAFTLAVGGIPPAVTTDPDHADVTAGDTVAFTASATGDPAPAVRWEVSTDEGATWDPVPGAGDTTLSFTTSAADDGHQYRAVFTNSAGEATSGAAVLTVGESPVFTSGTAAALTLGETTTFTVTVDTRGRRTAIDVAGVLPRGVTFTDHGDGTAVIAGSPTRLGTFPLVLTADNGYGVAATQALVLTVSPRLPSVTSPTVTVAELPSAPVFGQELRATATVGGAGAGAVQFALDGVPVGAPVALAAGVATSPGLEPEPGDHRLTATYLPDDPARDGTAAGTRSFVVGRAATSVLPSVGPDGILADVSVLAPGAGEPDGIVTFVVDGAAVGTAPVTDGRARLPFVVPSGARRVVTAEYAGTARFAPASGEVLRSDPVLTADLSSEVARSAHGWYRAPVLVSFRCEPTSAPLARPCPQPRRIRAEGRDRQVVRKAVAVDGGRAEVRVRLSIDTTDPLVRLRERPSGRLVCRARDTLSGIDTCEVTRTRTAVVAVAVDRAGNTAVAVRRS